MNLLEEQNFCTREYIFKQSPQDRCNFVNSNCGDKFQFVNYFYFHFCLVDQTFLATIPLCVTLSNNSIDNCLNDSNQDA